MGLFKSTATDPSLTAAIGSTQHRAVARQCVRESLVLLKNEGHVLPLSPRTKHLVVVGAGADDLGRQCGGWTVDWQGGLGNVTHGGTTLLAAIRQAVSAGTQVDFSPDAANVAGAEVILAVVGEPPYAEMKGDREQLNLSVEDTALIARAKATGTPVVTVLYSGRPLILGPALADSAAFVAAWLPGSEGLGITDVLFGNHPFTGRLPRDWPADNQHLVTGDTAVAPLFPFGFGLTD
jgi:beta-glucosidase